MVISSFTASKMTMMVGRIMSASGTPMGSGFCGRQALDKAHRVVAQIAENPGGHRRQVLRDIDARRVEKSAQRRQGARLASGECRAILKRSGVDFGPVAVGAPEDIGIEPDDRIASADRTALDRFEQEGVGLAGGELEHRRDRRFKVCNQACENKLSFAGVIARGKLGRRRFDLHCIYDLVKLRVLFR